MPFGSEQPIAVETSKLDRMSTAEVTLKSRERRITSSDLPLNLHVVASPPSAMTPTNVSDVADVSRLRLARRDDAA
ncbi:MAG: hypothetical protein BGO98_44510 [Myxococcales bacterium 68-20]|nr:MAG: hypothetical protein BGO98_44510 [Myxococcales bacterium 68-20]